MQKVTVDDLGKAAEWLRAYEPAPDEDGSGIFRVADWIEREMTRRLDRAANRSIDNYWGNP